MRTTVRVIQGRLAESEPHRTSAIEAAYQHFRLDKQGSLVSAKTLQHYEWTIRPFLRWLDEEHPQVLRFEQLNVEMVRQYRVDTSQRLTTRGRLPEPATLNDLHRLLMTFLRWAEDEGYAVDPRMRRLKAPRVPLKEATVLHIAQLREVLAACNAERPQEELIVRMLVGSGVRAAELCGLAVRGPDGLPDLMLDSLTAAGWSSVCDGTPAPKARSRAECRSHPSWRRRSSATRPDIATTRAYRASWSMIGDCPTRHGASTS